MLRSGKIITITIIGSILFAIPAMSVAESDPPKMELSDAIAKKQEETKTTEAQIQKIEVEREALLKESRDIQTEIKRRGLKDRAKADTRAMETAREMYAKTKEYNNLQKTLDEEQNKAFADWGIAKGKWLVGDKTKKDWDATDEAKKLKKGHQQRLDGSYGKWKSEMDELAKKGSKGFGIDESVVEDQDQRQKNNLESFKKNDERLDQLKARLEELKKMSDHDFQREQEKPKETEDEEFKKLQEEEFNKALEQARTLIGQGRASEAAAQGVIGKITAALNAAQQAEVKMSESASVFEQISQKINLMNQLGTQASNLAPAVLNTGLLGEAVATSAYEDVRQAKDSACDIAANIKDSASPQGDAQRAMQAADSAEMASAEVEGEGAAAASTVASAKATLGTISGLRTQAQDLEIEIAGLRAQLSDLPGVIAAASSQVSAVSGNSGEISKFTAEVESAKSGALGILNLYAARSEAQILIGQANTLGSSLKSERGGESLIQEATAILGRLQARSLGSISSALPAFPVDMAPLEDKVEDLRATADTIEIMESQCSSTAGAARACANKAQSNAQNTSSPPTNSGPSDDTPPPPWWSPTGKSVEGPQVPGKGSQTSSFQGATGQIESNLNPPAGPSSGAGQEHPGQPLEGQQPPFGGQEHPGQTYGGESSQQPPSNSSGSNQSSGSGGQEHPS